MKRFKHSRLLLSVCVLAVVLVGTTLALQVSGALSLTNRFSVGENDTTITETGDEKQVRIVNNSENPTYVRARVTVENKGDNGQEALPKELSVMYCENNIYDAPNAVAPANTIVVVINTTNWQKDNDDFYYYTKILPGKTKDNPTSVTDLFVKKVLVGEGVDKLLGDDGFNVVVYEESALALESAWTQAGMDAAFAELDGTAAADTQ